MPRTPRILRSRAVSCGERHSQRFQIRDGGRAHPECLQIIARHIRGAGKTGELQLVLRLQTELRRQFRIDQSGVGAGIDQEIKWPAIIDGDAHHHEIAAERTDGKSGV